MTAGSWRFLAALVLLMAGAAFAAHLTWLRLAPAPVSAADPVMGAGESVLEGPPPAGTRRIDSGRDLEAPLIEHEDTAPGEEEAGRTADVPSSELLGEDGEAAFLESLQDLSFQELESRTAALAARFKIECERISKELMEAGRYETILIPEGERFEFPKPKHSGPVSVGLSLAPGPGYSELKLAPITPEEFPEFRALQLKTFWMRNELRRRRERLHDVPAVSSW